MSWNYRVMKDKDGNYGIHEVYYTSEGKPIQSTVNSMVETEESIKALTDVLKKYTLALDKPVLDENHKETT